MAFDPGESSLAFTIVKVTWGYPHFPLLMAVVVLVAFSVHVNRLVAVLSGMTILPSIFNVAPCVNRGPDWTFVRKKSMSALRTF